MVEIREEKLEGISPVAGRFFLGLLLFLGCLYPVSAETQSGSAWNTRKIADQVLTDTAAGEAGDFIVLLNNQAPVLKLAASQPDRRSRRKSIMEALKQAAATVQTAITMELQRFRIPYRSFWIVNALAVRGDRDLVERLAAREEVARIESDRSFPVLLEKPSLGSPQGPDTVPWNIQMVNAPFLWGLGFTGQGVVYANADTGVQWDHPALKNQYRGWDGQTADHDYHWWDAVHEDLSGNGTNPCGFSSPVPCDDDGHGTHTLGTWVGDASGDNQIGMAPGSRWIACRNMEEGWGRTSAYLECFEFFLAPTDRNGRNPDPDRGPDVLGNSYSCNTAEGCSAHTLQAALENMRMAGIFVVGTAGNSGGACGSIADPPGLEDAVITVGSVDFQRHMAGDSGRGPVTVDGSNRIKPDLVAPGVSVHSSYTESRYITLSGTSMAVPHVAGAAALLWSAFPSLIGQVDQTEALLKATAQKIATTQICGGIPPDQVPNPVFGYGLIDVRAAYEAGIPPDYVLYLPLILH